MMMRPPAASTNRRACVAMPESLWRKFSATRSAVSRRAAPPPYPRLGRRPAQRGPWIRLDERHEPGRSGLGPHRHTPDRHLERLLGFGALFSTLEQHFGGPFVGTLVGLPRRIRVVGHQRQ